MTTQAHQAWLPLQALEAGTVERNLSTTVDEWSRKWFACRPQRLRPDRAAPPRQATRESCEVLEGGLGLALLPGGAAAIAGGILDLQPDERLAAGDETIVERLAAGCLEDLRGRLTLMLKLPADSDWTRQPAGAATPFQPAAAWTIGPSESAPALHLSISAEIQVALVKQAVRSVPVPIELRPLAEGLARQPVGVSAFIGSTELRLADIASLAPGDVVVIDRNLTEPLELAIDGAGHAGGCVIEPEDDRLQLKITKPYFG